MYGLSAVATAVLRSRSSRQRASSARDARNAARRQNTRMASRRIDEASSAFQAITGIITFSSS